MRLPGGLDFEGVAVRWGGDLSYGALRRRVAGVAQELSGRAGQRVALHLPHGNDAPVWLLGCWAAGVVPVPLDLQAPLPRLRALVERSGAELVVSSGRRGRSLLRQLPVAGRLAEDVGDGEPRPEWDWAPEDPALILWTSGSTGEPKGVTIPARAVAAFVDHWMDRAGVGEGSRVAWVAALSFDLSLFDLGALSRGATVVPVPEATLAFPDRLAAWLDEQQITHWYSVPTLLRGLLEGGACGESLRWVGSAGERLEPALVRDITATWPGAQLTNLFGPTETNVSTAWTVPAGWSGEVVPIGEPCPYLDLRLVDGEIQARGGTTMLGYWGEPDRATWDGGWLRTGDRAERGDDGLVFRGRDDRMVKVRGYRVELDAVEAALRKAGAQQAAVVAVGGELRAWVVGADPADLASIAQWLPRYAQPSAVVRLDALPRTDRGKIDRLALAESAS